jgi:hypothetical protein
VDVVSLNDDVAGIDADSEYHSSIERSRCISLGFGTLHLDGTTQCIHHTMELNQQPITHGFHESPLVRGDLRLENLA